MRSSVSKYPYGFAIRPGGPEAPPGSPCHHQLNQLVEMSSVIAINVRAIVDEWR